MENGRPLLVIYTHKSPNAQPLMSTNCNILSPWAYIDFGISCGSDQSSARCIHTNIYSIDTRLTFLTVSTRYFLHGKSNFSLFHKMREALWKTYWKKVCKYMHENWNLPFDMIIWKTGKNEVSERAFFIPLKERKNEGKPLIRDVSENKKEWFINDPKRNER